MGGARTFYEALDLSTPEAALDTFVDRYRREDFLAVYFILAPWAQSNWEHRLGLLQYDRLVRYSDDDELMAILADTPAYQGGLRAYEHFDTAYYFDYLMLAASNHSALLVDLRGDVTIGHIAAREHPQHGNVTDITASVGGIQGEVVLRMQQSWSGRWRLLQIVLPGGNEENIPWAVP